MTDEGQHLCDIVERETGRLNDLVDDMLQLARPRQPVLGDVDVARTAREVVALAAQSGRGADVMVRYDGPPESESLVTRPTPGSCARWCGTWCATPCRRAAPGPR